MHCPCGRADASPAADAASLIVLAGRAGSGEWQQGVLCISYPKARLCKQARFDGQPCRGAGASLPSAAMVGATVASGG